MTARQENTRYQVRLSVPRRGGVRAWGAVSGDFERRLAGQENPAVTGARIDSETRRGRDYIRVTIAATVIASDVAEALDAAWQAFREAAAGDLGGWDSAAAVAEVRPGEPLTDTGRRPARRAYQRARPEPVPAWAALRAISARHCCTPAGTRSWLGLALVLIRPPVHKAWTGRQ